MNSTTNRIKVVHQTSELRQRSDHDPTIAVRAEVTLKYSKKLPTRMVCRSAPTGGFFGYIWSLTKPNSNVFRNIWRVGLICSFTDKKGQLVFEQGTAQMHILASSRIEMDNLIDDVLSQVWKNQCYSFGLADIFVSHSGDWIMQRTAEKIRFPDVVGKYDGYFRSALLRSVKGRRRQGGVQQTGRERAAGWRWEYANDQQKRYMLT